MTLYQLSTMLTAERTRPAELPGRTVQEGSNWRRFTVGIRSISEGTRRAIDAIARNITRASLGGMLMVGSVACGDDPSIGKPVLNMERGPTPTGANGSGNPSQPDAADVISYGDGVSYENDSFIRGDSISSDSQSGISDEGMMRAEDGLLILDAGTFDASDIAAALDGKGDDDTNTSIEAADIGIKDTAVANEKDSSTPDTSDIAVEDMGDSGSPDTGDVSEATDSTTDVGENNDATTGDEDTTEPPDSDEEPVIKKGSIVDANPDGSAPLIACTTLLPGDCAVGTEEMKPLPNGQFEVVGDCIPNVMPGINPQLACTGKDEDCNGQILWATTGEGCNAPLGNEPWPCGEQPTVDCSDPKAPICVSSAPAKTEKCWTARDDDCNGLDQEKEPCESQP